ncbi:MAG: hypothetical protein R3F20_01040 [Planctomycetota bacterium]
MKPLPVILICLVTSALGAGGMHFLLADRGGEGARLHDGDDSVYNANRRMEELEARLDRFQAEVEPIARTLQDAVALGALQPGKLESMEKELAALRASIAELPSGEAGAPVRLIGDDGEEIVASASDLESYIAQRVDEKVKKSAKTSRRQQFKQWAPFAKMGMTRQLQRNAKKLGLNEEQTKRLEKRSQEAFDAVMPRFGVLMDSEATPEEREQAMAEIQSEVEVTNNDAESYMTPEQYQEFLEMQSQQSQQMNQFMQTMGSLGGQGGGPPGASPGGGIPPTPAAPTGN